MLVRSAVTLAACGQAASRPNNTQKATTSTKARTPRTALSIKEQAIVTAIANLPVNTTYPNFVPAKTAGVNSGAGCPSTLNVDRSATLTSNEAVALENSINADLSAKNSSFVRYFDRALLDMPSNGFAQLFGQNFGSTVSGSYTLADVSTEPLASDGSLANSVSSACGSSVMRASWRIVFCSPNTAVNACDPVITTTELAIDRNGQWLIWYLGSGLQ
ncbi:hypothetical protein [Ferrimicrobium acidiphilum]|uniref:hypothetical protein n=1 Tax=Ferrimicrobium acidiphilum TaxID=121039 RepID=UPI001364DD1C|nr:hypothetical protein [Ferrimicrobium acidiphilum]